MIIWGSKGKTKVLSTGIFHCPRCGVNRTYEEKLLGKYFTLYFIPLFKTKDIANYIECTFCRTPYELSVLEYDSRNQEAARKLLATIKDEVDSGEPLQHIYSAMVASGIKDEMANTVIGMATEGKIKQCNDCKLLFSGNLEFCSNCGRPLTSVQQK